MRGLRLFRVLRLTRLLKLVRLLQLTRRRETFDNGSWDWAAISTSNVGWRRAVPVMQRLKWILLATVFVCHLLACTWHGMMVVEVRCCDALRCYVTTHRGDGIACMRPSCHAPAAGRGGVCADALLASS
jgi:hypothetical protein